MTHSPGVRFSRIGSSTDPIHILDLWLLVDGVARDQHYAEPAPYRRFWRAVDDALGKSARFVFIGELDPREDLSPTHRLEEILEEIGVDITNPIVSSTEIGVSLHGVPRWPGYYILIRGTTVMATYVFRLSGG